MISACDNRKLRQHWNLYSVKQKSLFVFVKMINETFAEERRLQKVNFAGEEIETKSLAV